MPRWGWQYRYLSSSVGLNCSRSFLNVRWILCGLVICSAEYWAVSSNLCFAAPWYYYHLDGSKNVPSDCVCLHHLVSWAIESVKWIIAVLACCWLVHFHWSWSLSTISQILCYILNETWVATDGVARLRPCAGGKPSRCAFERGSPSNRYPQECKRACEQKARNSLQWPFRPKFANGMRFYWDDSGKNVYLVGQRRMRRRQWTSSYHMCIVIWKSRPPNEISSMIKFRLESFMNCTDPHSRKQKGSWFS